MAANMLDNMLGKILRKIRLGQHLHAAKAVLQTPPLVPSSDRVVLFSMIGTRVLLPYLVAVKSFHSRLGKGRVELLDDGTLTAADRYVLSYHLGDPKIHDFVNVINNNCPKGGCWERLLKLLDITGDDYVIQIDSDTVTVGDIPEIKEAVASNRSFTLLGESSVEKVGLLSLPDFTNKFHPYTASSSDEFVHVQHAIERRWTEYPLAGHRFYVRGCAAFAGFSRGGEANRNSAETLSQFAERTIGHSKWSQWGSEQVASNFLIANNENPLLLPYSRYRNYWNDPVPPDIRFLHFIGTHRYSGQEYIVRTKQAIADLKSG